MRTVQESETTIHSLKGKEVELMLQPLPWQLQGMYSAPGYSFGEHLGCHVRAGKEVISKGELWGR